MKNLEFKPVRSSCRYLAWMRDLRALTLLLVSMFGLPAVAQAAVVTPLNGNFELPAPLLAGEIDVTAFPGWTEFQAASWGASSDDAVNRQGTPGFQGTTVIGFPAGTDGQTIVVITNLLGSSGMFQDLGTMVASQKYTFSAAISRPLIGNTENKYRISFIGDYVGDPLITPAGNILASITDADFAPPSGGTTITTFDYTTTAADDGAPLRLQLEALESAAGGPGGFNGVDAVVVSVVDIDTDGDGVIDREDLCPDTAAAVGINGGSLIFPVEDSISSGIRPPLAQTFDSLRDPERSAGKDGPG